MAFPLGKIVIGWQQAFFSVCDELIGMGGG